MISVTKRFTFEASHRLPNYNGDCARLHGHSYKLEVELSGRINDSTGMVVDFSKLSKMVKDLIIDVYDHQYLNDFFPNPTAENMVGYFSIVLDPIVDANFPNAELTRLSLWETEKCYATWRKRQ